MGVRVQVLVIEGGMILHRILWSIFSCCDAMKSGSSTSQSAITCSKLTIETLEQGVKYVQS